MEKCLAGEGYNFQMLRQNILPCQDSHEAVAGEEFLWAPETCAKDRGKLVGVPHRTTELAVYNPGSHSIFDSKMDAAGPKLRV
jgi:hypothetical protein